MQRNRPTKTFPLNEVIVSLNSMYSESFSFPSFKMEKVKSSGFGWEAPNCAHNLDPFEWFSKFFKCTAMLTGTSPTSSGGSRILEGGGDFLEGRGDSRQKPIFEAHLR